MKNKLKQTHGSWYFLISIIIIYLVIFFIRSDLFFLSIISFYNLLQKIIPIFVLVFLLMSLTNYLITKKFVLKHLRRKGIKKWFFIIIGGILSTGPIYMWYPLLVELKNKGLSYGSIACFLYNRAIKIPILPIAIFYFGLEYILVLSTVMVFISIIQGVLIDRLIEN